MPLMTTEELEARLRSWAKPVSETEAFKCQNAERMIREAIRGHPSFGAISVDVYGKGSYTNNTNVRLKSDVDICACYTDAFYHNLPTAEGVTRESLGLQNHPYGFSEFWNSVNEALVLKFGQEGVTPGRKAFDVHSNSYRVDADVVACFEYRHYFVDANGSVDFHPGSAFYTSGGDKIVNFSKQHTANGIAKNTRTGNRFKYMVRVLKRARDAMVEAGYLNPESVASFLIESLV